MSKDWEFLEVLWENRMVTDAEDRYLKRIEDKEVVETKLGEKLLEEIAIPVSEVIKKRQQQGTLCKKTLEIIGWTLKPLKCYRRKQNVKIKRIKS